MSWACCFPFKMISQQMSWNAHPHNQSQCPCHMKTDLNCIIAISSYLTREPFDLIIFLLFFGFKSLGSEVTCGLCSVSGHPQPDPSYDHYAFAKNLPRGLNGLAVNSPVSVAQMSSLQDCCLNAKIRFNFNLFSTVCVALGT